jgi:hypothetical protein
MDRQHFDDLARALAQGGATRRNALRILVGGAFASIGVTSVAEAKGTAKGDAQGKNRRGDTHAEGCFKAGKKCLRNPANKKQSDTRGCNNCCDRVLKLSSKIGRCCRPIGGMCTSLSHCCALPGVDPIACIDGRCTVVLPGVSDIFVPAPPITVSPPPPPPPTCVALGQPCPAGCVPNGVCPGCCAPGECVGAGVCGMFV